MTNNIEFENDLLEIENMNELELVEELYRLRRRYNSNEEIEKIEYRLVNIEDKQYSKKSKKCMVEYFGLFRDELILVKEKGLVLPCDGGLRLLDQSYAFFQMFHLVECFAYGRSVEPEKSRLSKVGFRYYSGNPYNDFNQIELVDLDALIDFFEAEINNLHTKRVTNFVEFQKFNDGYKIRLSHSFKLLKSEMNLN